MPKYKVNVKLKDGSKKVITVRAPNKQLATREVVQRLRYRKDVKNVSNVTDA